MGNLRFNRFTRQCIVNKDFFYPASLQDGLDANHSALCRVLHAKVTQPEKYNWAVELDVISKS